jgi:Xaa-Pro aminopeptidase
VTDVAARPAIPAVRHAQRLEAAADLARERGLDALLIGVGADLRYLTGYRALALERLTMLVIRPGDHPTLVAHDSRRSRRAIRRRLRAATSACRPGTRPTTRSRSSRRWSAPRGGSP